MRQLSSDDKNLQDHPGLPAETYRLDSAVLRAIDLAVVSITPDGLITTFNYAAENMFQYAAHELIGKSDLLVLFEKQELDTYIDETRYETGLAVATGIQALRIRINRKKEPELRKWTLIKKDGTRFPAKVSIMALKDKEGDKGITGFVATIEDLSKQNPSHAHIAESEQRFRLLAENIPGAIYLCHNDPEFTMIYLNNRIEDITGYAAREFLSGKINIAELFHPDDAAMIYQQINDALESKTNFLLQYRIRHRSGEWRWIHEVGVGVYLDNKLLMIEGFMSDITLQKLAEEKLQQVAEENMRVFNIPVNLNAIAGFDGYFKRVSASWKEVLGWEEEELKAVPFLEFVHSDDAEKTREAFASITSGHNLLTLENRYRAKDGTYRWLLWGSAPDMQNRLIYSSAVDITDRKQYEQQLLDSKKNLEAIATKLQQQNRQLDEFAHIISHNLRSPIGNIQALINLLDDTSSIEDYKVIYDKLKNVAKNLGETMNELMDTLKLKTGTPAERTEIRFREILDRVIQSLEGELILAGASVTFNFAKPSIHYSKPYIESIFQNLLSNAIKYRSPNRKLEIHFGSAEVNGITELTVSDNGQGIDLEKFGDSIFGLHKTFHEHREARGVGLFLIKTQIESMGGSIEVESEVDKGSRFIIRFAPDT